MTAHRPHVLRPVALHVTPSGGDDWRQRAACAGSENPDAWFPGRGVGHTADYLHALQTCRSCPVRGECLEDALTHHPVEGLWGGMSETERAELAKGRKRPLKIETHGERACYQYGCRCEACIEGNRAYERRNRAPRDPGRRDRKPCGTNTAYVRHIRAGEEPCDPCLVAHRAYAAEQMRRTRRSRVEMSEESS